MGKKGKEEKWKVENEGEDKAWGKIGERKKCWKKGRHEKRGGRNKIKEEIMM